MSNYTVYHLHDDYSNVNGGFADSATQYHDYIKLAKESGMKAIAFSNHGGIYDWVLKKMACDKAGLKYIHGVELYLTTTPENNHRGWHIGLYSKNLDGVKELNSLMSKATSKGVCEDNTDRYFYYNPRITIEQLKNTSDNIIVTTACIASPLWQLSLDIQEAKDENEKQEYTRIFMDLVKWLADNKHRCFLEIQYHNHPSQIAYNKLLYKLHKKFDIPLIAGTDTHSSSEYKAKCRTILQKYKQSSYGDEDSFDLTWKTYDELVEAFKIQNAIPEKDYMKAIENTNVFADMVDEFDLDYSFKYPNLYGDNANEIWKELIFNKLKEKFMNGACDYSRLEEYKARVLEEYDAMVKQGMASFMIFMSELMTYARSKGINSSPCRGSVGGSLIAYITDVTDVDPLVWDTVFSRFCNADRVSLMDIDQDFSPKDRDVIYDYIIDRFGLDRVAYIATFQRLQDRGTIDALAKGLEYDNLDKIALIKDTYDTIISEYSKIIMEEVNIQELEGATSGSPSFDDHDLYIQRIANDRQRNRVIDLKLEWDRLKMENEQVFYYFEGVKGVIMSKGVHAAGIIGSPITLPDNLGVFYKDGDDHTPVSFCSMDGVDRLNYVKYDILGLKTIGIIQDTYRYIGKKWLYAHEIDWQDEEVWKDMIKTHAGVFQFEKPHSHDVLKKMKPRTINDMSLVNAAIRPAGKSYRDRLVNREDNPNPSKEIDELLADNHGFLVFQEDTIKFLTEICGFSGSEADTTRRAIGNKDVELLNEQLPKIIEGYCKVSPQPREIAEQEVKQFLQIISDSSEYQFGYNHSTGYSMNGFVCCMLRRYYPLEFATAYMNWAENAEDIEYSMELIKTYGITLNPPRFKYSRGEFFFDKETNSIYKGIGSIKGFSNKDGEELYRLRDNKYNSFAEVYIDIMENTSIGQAKVEDLIKLDFFVEYGKAKKLLHIKNICDMVYGKKLLNKKTLDTSLIPSHIISKYSRETKAQFRDLDNMSIINEASLLVDDQDIPLKTKLSFELEKYGYVATTLELSEPLYFVLDIKEYKRKNGGVGTRYIIMYNVSNGEEVVYKCTNYIKFLDKPFKIGDIVIISSESKERKRRKDKTTNKWYYLDDEFNNIMEDWEAY